jgi:hypothetical protein
MIRRFVFDNSLKQNFKFVSFFPYTYQSGIKFFSTKELEKLRGKIYEAKHINNYHNENNCRIRINIKNTVSELEKLCEDKVGSDSTDKLKNKWFYLNDISYNISKSKNEKEIKKMLYDLNIKNIEELQNLKLESFAKFKESLEHKKLIEEKEDELNKWIELYHDFDKHRTMYDDKIIQLTKEKMEINKKIKKEYENRKRCLRFTNLPFV